MRLLIYIPIILFLLYGIVACTKYHHAYPASKVVFKAYLTGNKADPPNISSAYGDATLVYDKNTKIFTLKVNYSGLVATMAHIHKGTPGVAGPVIFPLSVATGSPIIYTSPVLTPEQETDLYSDFYYVNIHSKEYPAGEIRGQLVKQNY